MQHASYPEILEVGCVCAGHMEENLTRAREREDALKKVITRRRRWPDLKSWKVSSSGDLTINKQGYRVTIFQKDDHWSGMIVDERTHFKVFARRKYTSERAAKLGAFDGIIWLQGKS